MNKENKMSVKEFINKFDQATSDASRKKILKNIVKKTYAPISEKKMMLQVAVDRSISKDSYGVKYIDMFVLRLNFYTVLIPLYTTLVINKDKENSPLVMEAYDLMQSRHIWDILFADALVEGELEELLAIEKNILDTFYNKEKSTEAIVQKVINSFSTKIGIAAGYAINELEKITRDKDLLSKVVNNVKTFVNKNGE